MICLKHRFKMNGKKKFIVIGAKPKPGQNTDPKPLSTGL